MGRCKGCGGRVAAAPEGGLGKADSYRIRIDDGSRLEIGPQLQHDVSITVHVQTCA